MKALFFELSGQISMLQLLSHFERRLQVLRLAIFPLLSATLLSDALSQCPVPEELGEVAGHGAQRQAGQVMPPME